MEFRKSSLDELNSPNLLVIGGTGFIGYHLLKALQLKEWKITSVSLNPPTEERLVENVRYLHFDLTDRVLVKNHLNENFDFVVNLGGYIDHNLFKEGGRTLIDTHFCSLQNLVEVLPRHKLKRFVQIGSSDEYGDATAPQHEELREQPISPYSLAKTACTHFLQMLHRTENFPVVILRLFLTYGPGQDSKRFIPQIIRGCIRDEAFPTTAGEQLRDFCYVEDTARAILQALTISKIEGEVFNISSGECILIRTVIENICTLTNAGKPQYGKIFYRPKENMALYADISKANKLLQWKPIISLVEGLKKTINYYENDYA